MSQIIPIEESQRLTSDNIFISNSNIIKIYKPSYSNICFTCCCPCFVLGEIRSNIERESNLSFFKKFGKFGCQECLLTTFFCSFCWPLSPLLSCYIYHQELQLHAIYNQNTKYQKTYKDLILQFICWPLSLYQHQQYLEKQKSNGLLHYNWAYSIPPEENCLPPTSSTTYAILILGPSNSGKTELLMKLTGRRIQNYNDPSFTNDEIRIGLKSVYLTNGDLYTLEFWDIPSTKLESITHIVSKIKYVLLLYDSNSRNSFKEMKEIFREIYCISNLSNASYICIAAKDDYQFFKTTQRKIQPSTPTDTLTPTIESEDLGPSTIELKAGREWAKERGFRFFPITSRYNYGITNILRVFAPKQN